MTAALLWKEYRQQRSIWISIALLGGLLVVTLTLVMGRGRGWAVTYDERLRSAVGMTVLCLMMAYGVICGAILMAGERDEGTEAFLDSLCSWRGPVWQRKVMAGVLFTVLQSAVMAGWAAGFGHRETMIALPLMGLEALAWGLLGGALCKTALTGVMTGIGMMGLSFLFVSFTNFNIVVGVGHVAAGVGAAVASRRIFCRDDRRRRPARKRGRVPAPERVRRRLRDLRLEIEVLIKEEESFERQSGSLAWDPLELESATPAPGKAARKVASEWRVMWWLVQRQGRWFLGAAIPLALLFSLLVHLSPLSFWPIGMLLMGVVFGTAAFGPDQNDGGRFLCTQRFPVGRLWSVKVLFWAAVMLLITMITWFIATEVIFKLPIVNMLLPDGAGGPAGQALTASPTEWIRNSMRWERAPGLIDALLLVLIWPLFGFSFGLLYGQLMRRPVLGAMQAAAVTPFVAAVWVPSLTVGGVAVWQVLLVPLVLIATTRFMMRAWLAGRLLDVKPLLGIAASAAAVPMVLAACMWYRAIEVPDVGEPFDVKAFVDSLPTADKNEANTLIRSACAEMSSVRRKVMSKSAPKIVDPPPDEEPDVELQSPSQFFPSQVMAAMKQGGWPKNDEPIIHWLDSLCTGEWPLKVQKAAGMPLGVVLDPRYPDKSGLDHDLIEMSNLLGLRSLQLQAQGDSRAGLKQLETLLALTRQVRHLATNDGLRLGSDMQSVAIATFHQWLQGVGPDKALIRDSLAMLGRHEAAIPDPAGSIKADYLAYPLDPDTLWPAFWEKERQVRIRNAVVAGLLREVNKPYWKTGVWKPAMTTNRMPAAASGLDTGLPLETGPGSNLSAAQWEKYANQAWKHGNTGLFYFPRVSVADSQQSIGAAQLVTAITLYQAENGNPPANLADLTSRGYLQTLPLNPFDGENYEYGIFDGGDFAFFMRKPLVPGQAYIVVRSGQFGQFTNALPVPYWKK